jgi:hypothetical protein
LDGSAARPEVRATTEPAAVSGAFASSVVTEIHLFTIGPECCLLQGAADNLGGLAHRLSIV